MWCWSRARAIGIVWLAAVFSAPLEAATLTVSNANDSGNGSLRQAITTANSTTTADLIQFAIPGTGPFTINVLTPLPTITQPLTIDGYSQPGAAPNTLVEGSDAVILVQLDGLNAGSATSGLAMCAAATIKGLSITRFLQQGIAVGSDANGTQCAAPHAGTVISGNFIGLAADGTTSRGNRFSGVIVDNASAIIGGTTAAARNVISSSGNNGGSSSGSHGIILTDPGSAGSSILGNYIGTDASGTQDRGNLGNGILVSIGASGVTIGGVAKNRIAYNFIGVGVFDSASGAAILGNEIFANDGTGNGGQGIDLYASTSPDGHTANDFNDLDTGGNGLQNFPAGITATRIVGGLHINATLDRGGTTSKTYTIGVYTSSSCDPSGFGEGERYLGDFTFVSANGAAQAISADLTFDQPLPIGSVIALTATEQGLNNTSEFSSCVTIDNTTPLVVTSAADTAGTSCGATCTFRQAITVANAQPGGDIIHFNIPGTGVSLIQPTTPLPTVVEALTIDGYTQPGAAVNTSVSTSNAVIKVQLDGGLLALGTAASGIGICSDDVTIRGLSITNFTLQSIVFGNTSNALACANLAPSGRSRGARLLGSFVGLTPSGIGGGSAFNGIAFVGADGQLGSGLVADRNVIGRNSNNGVSINNAAVDVDGNLIGIDPTGVENRGNGQSGIAVQNGGNQAVRIGQRLPNSIRFNREGLRVLSTASNAVFYANDFADNLNLGIDLCASATCPDGVTANDVDDADVGGNSLQNTPVLTGARLFGGTMTVDSSLDVSSGTSSQPHVIAFYASATCDGSTRGEGALYLGSVSSFITNAAESFTMTVPVSAPVGSQITATATFSSNTSEFSNCVPLQDGNLLFANSFE